MCAHTHDQKNPTSKEERLSRMAKETQDRQPQQENRQGMGTDDIQTKKSLNQTHTKLKRKPARHR